MRATRTTICVRTLVARKTLQISPVASSDSSTAELCDLKYLTIRHYTE